MLLKILRRPEEVKMMKINPTSPRLRGTSPEVPEAYRIGWVPFIHTNIHLDSRPLIPRTETEYWVNEVICKLKTATSKPIRVLDLCAGSGAIGIALLKEIPDAQVDFAELDERHHPTIMKNILMNEVDPNRTRIFGGDLFEKITDTYDFILSNPPYVDKELKRVEESVKTYEPALALYGGEKGLEIIERILSEAKDYLRKDGRLYLEHEPEQTFLLSQNPNYRATFKDQYGVERYSEFKLPD